MAYSKYLAEARIFTRSNNNWALHGKFDTVMERDPVVHWDSSTELPKLILLAQPPEPSAIVITAAPAPILAVKNSGGDSATVIGLLGLSDDLLSRPSPIPLQLAYQKFKAVNKGWLVDIPALRLAGNWPFPNFTRHQLIEIFVSKTTWYEHFKHFARVEEGTALEMWLIGGDDAPSGFQAFGCEKEIYSWSDLCKALDEEGDVVAERKHKKGKGKGKAKNVVVKGKGKAKEVEVQEQRKSKRKKADDSPKQKKSKSKKKKTL